MIEELLRANIFHVLLIFVRIGAAISIMPGFSAGYVSLRVRLTVALLISFAMVPVLGSMLPVLPEQPGGLFILLVREMIVGLFIGLTAQIIFAALQIAGAFISMYASLANALVQDATSEQQSSLFSGFLGLLGIVLIFVTDAHHLMLRAIVDSYAAMPPQADLRIGDLANALTAKTADAFALGAQFSAPALILSVTYNVGLGLLGRLMPQLPVFFFGAPAHIYLQLWALMLTISSILLIFIDEFAKNIVIF
jgi:flagellar biosynthetic protein FliR